MFMNSPLYIKDIVSNTVLNQEGVRLFDAISNSIEEDEIILSLTELEPMSTSFMNSSFGTLIDKYGLETVKNKIKLIDYRPTQARRIQDYFERYLK